MDEAGRLRLRRLNRRFSYPGHSAELRRLQPQQSGWSGWSGGTDPNFRSCLGSEFLHPGHIRWIHFRFHFHFHKKIFLQFAGFYGNRVARFGKRSALISLPSLRIDEVGSSKNLVNADLRRRFTVNPVDTIVFVNLTEPFYCLALFSPLVRIERRHSFKLQQRSPPEDGMGNPYDTEEVAGDRSEGAYYHKGYRCKQSGVRYILYSWSHRSLRVGIVSPILLDSMTTIKALC